MTVQRVAFLLALIGFVGCEGGAVKSDRKPDLAESPLAPASKPEFPSTKSVPPLDSDVWRGVCLAHSWEDRGVRGYGTDSSAEVLEHLQTVGVNWVSLTPFGFMESTQATEIRGEHSSGDLPHGAERSRAVAKVAEQARKRGIKSVLKPHIWIRGGEWRGRIVPKNEAGETEWEAWWTSYEEWILFWAKIARDAQIESFVVGVELHTAVVGHPDRFIEVISKVRDVYDGEVHYAANWNEPVPKKVWKTLDAVGVQFYPPLAEAFDAPPNVLRKTLREHLDAWNAVAEEVDRPLMLTEVGYRSAVSAATHPNAWPERTKGKFAKTDEQMQRDVYALFFEELHKTERLAGVFIWKYFTDRETDEEGPAGFSPRSKPAEAVLKSAFRPPGQ